jgi:hypothetical protein
MDAPCESDSIVMFDSMSECVQENDYGHKKLNLKF